MSTKIRIPVKEFIYFLKEISEENTKKTEDEKEKHIKDMEEELVYYYHKTIRSLRYLTDINDPKRNRDYYINNPVQYVKLAAKTTNSKKAWDFVKQASEFINTLDKLDNEILKFYPGNDYESIKFDDPTFKKMKFFVDNKLPKIIDYLKQQRDIAKAYIDSYKDMAKYTSHTKAKRVDEFDPNMDYSRNILNISDFDFPDNGIANAISFYEEYLSSKISLLDRYLDYIKHVEEIYEKVKTR
jgi:hypothetical protein